MTRYYQTTKLTVNPAHVGAIGKQTSSLRATQYFAREIEIVGLTFPERVSKRIRHPILFQSLHILYGVLGTEAVADNQICRIIGLYLLYEMMETTEII